MADMSFVDTAKRSTARVETQVVGAEQSSAFRRLLSPVLLYGTMIFAAIIALVPFFWMISNSLMTLGETQVRKWLPNEPQFMNYIEAWNEAKFSVYFLNSAVITAVTIVGLLLMTVMAAYAFARIKFIGRNAMFTLLLLTLMIPEAVTLIPNYLVVGGAIFPLPIITQNFPFLTLGMVGDKANTWIDTLAALTVPFMGSAFSIFLLRQFFAQIPNELWDAARIDGAGHVRFLVQIVLPISRAPMLTITLLTFIASWNSFLWPLIVTNDDRVRPITVGLYRFSSEAGTQFHLLMAASVITIAPILILYFLTQKTFTDGIATTGLKG